MLGTSRRRIAQRSCGFSTVCGFLLSLSGALCDTSAIEKGGAAEVTLTADGETPLNLLHNQDLSDVTLTPPASGVVEIAFNYQDPLVDVAITLDSKRFSQGDSASFPAAGAFTDDELSMTVSYADEVYTSQSDSASGTIDFELLHVDDNGADVRVAFDVQLATSSAKTLSVSGFIEDIVGSPGVDP